MLSQGIHFIVCAYVFAANFRTMSEEHDTNTNNLKAGSNLEKLLRKGEFVVT